jgi:hypothetical protein
MKEKPQGKSPSANGGSVQRMVSTRYQFKTDFDNREVGAVTFDLMNSPYYEGERWAVRRNSACLNKDGEWEYEPLPSSRDDDFYARCRFESLEIAVAAYESANDKAQRPGHRNSE